MPNWKRPKIQNPFRGLKTRLQGFLQKLRPGGGSSPRLPKFAERIKLPKASQLNVKDQIEKLKHSKALEGLNQIRHAPKEQRLGLALSAASSAWEKGLSLFEKQGFDFWGKLVTITLSTWFLADVVALIAESVIPDPPTTVKTALLNGGASHLKTIDRYSGIAGRNLFNSEGKIPGEGGATQPSEDTTPLATGSAVRTTLPLELVGTLILGNEDLSVATIQDKTKQMAYPVRIGDQIPSLARIIRIESRKVTFVNLRNGKSEFVDMPDDGGVTPRISTTPVQTGKKDGRRFTISRSKVDETLGDLSKVLTQARAVPHFENGEAAGFKLFQIVPGSIYDELGLVNNDILRGVNGEAISDPGKAFSLMNELKESKTVEVTVTRGGKDITFTYDIQ